MRLKLAGLLTGLWLSPSLVAAQEASPVPAQSSAPSQPPIQVVYTDEDPADICALTGCLGPFGPIALTASMRQRASAGGTPGATLLYDNRIDELQPVSLADLLENRPAVGLARSLDGTEGRLRGGGAPLVLIDGLVVNDPLTGGFDLSALPVQAFRRVEILTGPQSADWGDGAGSGLIALGDDERADSRARVSSDGSWAADFARSGSATDSSGRNWALGLTGFRDRRASQAAGGGERDPRQTVSLGLAGGWNLNPKGPPLDFQGGLRLTDSRDAIDGFDPLGRFVDAGDHDRRQSVLAYGGLSARAEPLGVWSGKQRLTIGYYGLSVDRGGGRPGYDASRRTFRYEVTQEDSGPQLSNWSMGLERTDARARIDGGRSGGQGISSIFAQRLGNYGGFDSVRIQVRLDLPDGFEPQVSARLSGLWWNDAITIKGSLGRGYSLPTLAQQLCDLCASPAPRPALQPEATLGWDLGLAVQTDFSMNASGSLDLALFGLRRDKVIGLDGGAYRNLGRVRTDGVELNAGLTAKDALVTLRYVFVDAEDGFTHRRPLGTPRHTARLEVAGDGPFDGSYIFSLRAQSSQTDLDPSTLTPRRRDGFVTADFNFSVYLHGDAVFYLRLENLADARYQQTLGYGEAGRTLWVGLRAGF